MRIVFVGTRGFPNVQGGIENHCENLTTNLVKLGCEVIVFVRKPYVDTTIREYKGVKLVPLPAIRHKSLEAFFHTFLGVLASLKYKPDIVHIQGIGPGFFSVLARLLGLKVVLTTHGSNYKHLKWNTLEKKFLEICEYIGVKFSNEVISISEPIANDLYEKYSRHSTIIPNGVNIIERVSSNQKLLELGLESGKYIFSVGRLVPEKGFHNLIIVFKKLELEGWKLVIAGEADHVSKYSVELMKISESDDRIIFTGRLTGLPLHELYSHAGLFVLPSYYEGLPISLLEALSFGLKCIASDIPGNRSIDLPGKCYFLPDDLNDMFNKIVKAVKFNVPSEEIHTQIKNVKQMYDWKIIAQKTLYAYTHLLGL